VSSAPHFYYSGILPPNFVRPALCFCRNAGRAEYVIVIVEMGDHRFFFFSEEYFCTPLRTKDSKLGPSLRATPEQPLVSPFPPHKFGEITQASSLLIFHPTPESFFPPFFFSSEIGFPPVVAVQGGFFRRLFCHFFSSLRMTGGRPPFFIWYSRRLLSDPGSLAFFSSPPVRRLRSSRTVFRFFSPGREAVPSPLLPY